MPFQRSLQPDARLTQLAQVVLDVSGEAAQFLPHVSTPVLNRWFGKKTLSGLRRKLHALGATPIRRGRDLYWDLRDVRRAIERHSLSSVPQSTRGGNIRPRNRFESLR